MSINLTMFVPRLLYIEAKLTTPNQCGELAQEYPRMDIYRKAGARVLFSVRIFGHACASRDHADSGRKPGGRQ